MPEHLSDASDARAWPLVRYLFAACVLLLVYASLYPFSGWRDPGGLPFAFLVEPFPRSVWRFDVVINVLGYMPLGFLAALAVQPRLRGAKTAVFGFVCSLALSFVLESLQAYLPSRTSSNVDLLTNSVGGALGAALGAVAAPALLREGVALAWRNRVFLAGPKIDLGLVLLALWLVAQLSPETLLFGTGDLRELFQSPPGRHYPAELFLRVEAGVACADAIALGLFVSCLAARPLPSSLVFSGLVGCALTARALAFGVLLKDLLWITPGALTGLVAGWLIALICFSLPRTVRLAVAGLALMGATALVNLAPENPYMAASLALWQRGPFFNLNGVTHVVSAAWPFVAMFYLVFLAADRGRESR